jgi:hypothetical protein
MLTQTRSRKHTPASLAGMAVMRLITTPDLFLNPTPLLFVVRCGRDALAFSFFLFSAPQE